MSSVVIIDSSITNFRKLFALPSGTIVALFDTDQPGVVAQMDLMALMFKTEEPVKPAYKMAKNAVCASPEALAQVTAALQAYSSRLDCYINSFRPR